MNNQLDKTMKTTKHILSLLVLAGVLPLLLLSGGCSTSSPGTRPHSAFIPPAIPHPGFVNYGAQKQMMEIIQMQQQLKMMNSFRR